MDRVPWYWLEFGGIGLLVLLFLVVVIYRWIGWRAKPYIVRDLNQVTGSPVALVLGTTERTVQGNPNPYFTARMEAAVDLFRGGKATRFILTGDGRPGKGNEVVEMEKALLKMSLPGNCLILDGGGYRTLVSLLRCRDRLPANREILLVSQKFHLERAIFLGRYLDMEVKGFCARSIGNPFSWMSCGREALARVRCLLDIGRLIISGKGGPPTAG